MGIDGMDAQVYEDRIKWLKRGLYHSELEIARLYSIYKEREILEQEISGLKFQVSSFVKKIRQLELVAEAREKFIEFQEEWLTEEITTLQEEITQLKARISELVSKKIPIDNDNMAQANPNPVAIILTNRTAMNNSLQAIRRHIDGSRVLNPVNLGLNFDNY